MKHALRSWKMLVGVLLLGCVAFPVAEAISGTSVLAQVADDIFERHEIVIGAAERQTLLPGFLLDGAIADLAVVNIGENDDRRVRIYAFDDGTWVENLDTTIGRDVIFVDVAHVGGRDRLVTYEPGRLNWFDPEAATEHALVAVASNFNPPRRGEVPMLTSRGT